MPQKNKLTQQIPALCLILIPLAFFGYIFRKYAVNIPHWDDLAVRNSLADFLTADSFTRRISILFSQHNEHRIFLTRVFALIVYQLTGTLNLKMLMLLGNAALAGILFLFYRFSIRNGLSLLALAPVSFLLFTSALYENVFWGMASVQNFWVILLAFLSLYFLVYSYNSSGNTYFYLAVISWFLGVFTSSNGILIPFLGLALLAFQKRYTELKRWAVVSALFLFFYFFNYHSSPDNTARIDFSSPSLLFKGFLAVLGNAVDVQSIAPGRHLDISMATGVIILILTGIFSFQVLFRKYNINQRNHDLFLLACLVFLGITCAGITAGRLSYGINTLLTSKYKINSILILCLCYFAVLRSVKESGRDKIIKIALGLAVIFNIYSNLAEYRNVSFLRRERVTDQFKIQHSDKQMPVNGIYARLQRPAHVFYDSLVRTLMLQVDTPKSDLHIEETATGFIISDTQPDTLKTRFPEAGLYFVLRSADNLYIFPSRVVTPHALQLIDYFNIRFLFGNRLNVASFVCDFSRFYVQSGTYQLGVIRAENYWPTVTWTSQSIHIQAIQKQKPRQNW